MIYTLHSQINWYHDVIYGVIIRYNLHPITLNQSVLADLGTTGLIKGSRRCPVSNPKPRNPKRKQCRPGHHRPHQGLQAVPHLRIPQRNHHTQQGRDRGGAHRRPGGVWGGGGREGFWKSDFVFCMAEGERRRCASRYRRHRTAEEN